MSGNKSLATLADTAIAEQKRKGLRVALAVSVGFTVAVASGAIVPFLGPLFAAQFLLSSPPLSVVKVIGMIALILAVGTFLMILTNVIGDRPVIFLMVLGLVYFCCFFVQANGKGGPAIFLILVVAIMVPLTGILNHELADSILSVLTTGVLGGALLMWLAYALIPETVLTPEQQVPAVGQSHPLWKAVANTAILLLAVTICLTNNQLATAFVIPITVASLLGQIDITAGGRMAIGLMIVNLMGGIAASFAYGILSLRPNLLSIFVIMLVGSLLLGGRAASRSYDAKMYAGALTIFIILFGLGVSPLPGSAAEAFSTRVTYVAVAMIYTFVMAALLWPGQLSASQRG